MLESSKMLFAILSMIILIAKEVDVTQDEPLLTYEKLYQAGIDAFRDKNWDHCRVFFTMSIEDFKFYKENLGRCRLTCRTEWRDFDQSSKETNKSEFSFDGLHMRFFERILQESRCLESCKKKVFGDRPVTKDREIAADFENAEPYHFLQVCYFQVKKIQDAASAEYTYFLRNPTDSEVIQNIQFYREKQNVPDSDFIDLEQRPYQTYHIDGDIAYDNEDWEGVVDNIEKALTEFYKEEELCQACCEDWAFDKSENTSDFVNMLAEQYVSVLKCQFDCEEKLSRIHAEQVDDFLTEHYNFLQFAYYKLGNLDKAVEAAATYLLLSPRDREMLANKDYYMTRLGYHDAHFVPRKDAERYHNQRDKIKKFLDFVEESSKQFGGDRGADDGPEEHYMKMYESIGINLFAEQEELKDVRFAADGFLREEHCDELRHLANAVKPDSDGFRKIAITDAVEIVKEITNYEISLRMFLRACEVTRYYTGRYFNETSFFIKNVTLVCLDPNSEDKSKEVCYFQEDGQCVTEEDFVQTSPDSSKDAEYIGVVYLTYNPEKGKLNFHNTDKEIEASVDTSCGRLVGFKVQDRHSVKHSDTQRCALAVMFTTKRDLENPEHRMAMKFLHDLEKQRAELFSSDYTKIMKAFQEEGVTVTMTGDQLKGGERFVADGLVSEEQCQALTKLANEGAVDGDGYRSLNKSPHTHLEIFAGLTILKAAQSEGIAGDGYKDKPNIKSNISPHSFHEIFEGLTIKRASQLAELKAITKEDVEMYLDISEKCRLYVERYFNLTRPLYFDYTHLVCRTAVEGEQEGRTDLSHPIHADNCQLQPDGTCLRQFPAYVQRDYSAILYLNDQSDFDGGEFFFADKNLDEQASLKPKCGRLVGFNAGELHGVKAITKGRRCAVAMWYTMDPNNAELAHNQARNLLSTLESKNPDTDGQKDSRNSDDTIADNFNDHLTTDEKDSSWDENNNEMEDKTDENDEMEDKTDENDDEMEDKTDDDEIEDKTDENDDEMEDKTDESDDEMEDKTDEMEDKTGENDDEMEDKTDENDDEMEVKTGENDDEKDTRISEKLDNIERKSQRDDIKDDLDEVDDELNDEGGSKADEKSKLENDSMKDNDDDGDENKNNDDGDDNDGDYNNSVIDDDDDNERDDDDLDDDDLDDDASDDSGHLHNDMVYIQKEVDDIDGDKDKDEIGSDSDARNYVDDDSDDDKDKDEIGSDSDARNYVDDDSDDDKDKDEIGSDSDVRNYVDDDSDDDKDKDEIGSDSDARNYVDDDSDDDKDKDEIGSDSDARNYVDDDSDDDVNDENEEHYGSRSYVHKIEDDDDIWHKEL